MDKTNKRVIEILKDMTSCWDTPAMTSTSRLREDLGLESLDILDLTMKAEVVFNIKIRPDEMSRVINVSDIVKLIESKIK